MSSRGSPIYLVSLILGLIGCTRAQIGELCACTPSIYEFVLDFSADCGSVILEPQGISGTNCQIDLFNPELPSDMVPERIAVIDTSEFGQNMQLVQQTTLFGDFFNGDSFSFVSSTLNPANLTQETVPRALQVSMLGEDANEVPLLMTWIIEFSNACNGQPVFSVGNQYAWTIFSNLTAPDPLLCPATFAPTTGPTPLVTFPPNGAPTRSPTLSPATQPPNPGPPTTQKPTVSCPPTTPGKGIGKGKGIPYQSREQFQYQYDEVYQVHHGQYPGRRLPATSSSSKSTKSYSEKSIKSPKSSSTGKGKGIWYHPTPAPTKEECVVHPTPAPQHHPVGGRNSGPTPASNPRPTFTGIQFFAPTPFHYRPPTSSPTTSPVGGDTNDQQGASDDQDDDEDSANDGDVVVGGFDGMDEDGGGSSGLNGAQIAFIIVLAVGVSGFILGGVVYFIYTNSQDDEEDDEDSQYSRLKGGFRQQENSSQHGNLAPRGQEENELRNAPFQNSVGITQQRTQTSLSHITDPWSHSQSTGSRRGELGPILSRGSAGSSGSVHSTFLDE